MIYRISIQNEGGACAQYPISAQQHQGGGGDASLLVIQFIPDDQVFGEKLLEDRLYNST
ncbi:MAG: hypothetical protein IPO72_16900 [Saprospiraceae bacterium]|nr:hypothetical protein [Candidatus Vicinibacter affinis]